MLRSAVLVRGLRRGKSGALPDRRQLPLAPGAQEVSWTCCLGALSFHVTQTQTRTPETVLSGHTATVIGVLLPVLAASCNLVSASKRATLHLPQKQIPCSQTRLDAIDPVGLTRCIFVDMEMMPATNDKDPAHSTAVGARLCAELQGMLASCTDRAVEPPAKLAEMLGDFLNAEASAAFKALQPQVDKHAEALLVEHGVSETAMRTRSLSLKQVSS